MSRNILITRRDWMQDPAAALSGGNWRSDAPLINVLDRRPQFVAEAINNVDWNNTRFTADLGYTRRVGLIYFANLRTTPMALISIKAGTDATFTTNAYEVLTTAWPDDGSDPFGTNPWGELALTHTYMRDEYERLGMPRFFVPPAVIDCRYIQVQIMDSTADTPLQIGCFGACEVWEAPVNFDYGWTISPIDESDVRNVPFGSTYVTERGMRQRLSLGFGQLAEDEFLARSFGLALIKGRSQPLVIVPFPADTVNLEKRSLYGLVSKDSEISNPFFARYAQPFQVDQLI